MATLVIMPKQGQSVETCIITKWFRRKGEKVSAGDILFSYETDKAAFDFESPADGVLLDIYHGEGAEVPVLQNVAVIGAEGEKYEAAPEKTVTAAASPAVAAAKNEPATASVHASTQIVTNVTNSKVRISPRAKKFAESKGVDYNGIHGSGPNGRIICADIENALSGAATSSVSAAPGQAFTDQPLTNIRRIIAKAMHASLQNSAQLTHHMSADVRNLLAARAKVKADVTSGKKMQDITLNDMICWCVIRALEKFPVINVHFFEDRIRTFSDVSLGLAVDTPRGLMVPAVKDAGKMDLVQLSRSLKSVADACRKGSIDPELIKPAAASFTVSNLGNYGVEMFTPVINLPQAGILGVCTIINRPADLGNNTFGFVPYIGLSLTYDHRAVDGGPATLFLKEIKDQIERFSLL
ncbi:MAG TPA: dihydrolipoamide acetyltransferase family protein [Bacteroidales bacterium]|jgi:pyruvate dehydrogenase E2 component (dihydrolipoamide acetyltransferase)|nr:dihydrolipoamide acetyltransferase family protein [Bacteroidales bacterium]